MHACVRVCACTRLCALDCNVSKLVIPERRSIDFEHFTPNYTADNSDEEGDEQVDILKSQLTTKFTMQNDYRSDL